MPEPRYFSIPSIVVGAAALRNEALNGDQVPLTASFDAEHAEPVLFVVERDALYEPS
jgi:hypothetical protein